MKEVDIKIGGINFVVGEPVWVVTLVEHTHTEKEDLGSDHLGHRGYRERTVTDSYSWEVSCHNFSYHLLSNINYSPDRIFKTKGQAELKKIKLEEKDKKALKDYQRAKELEELEDIANKLTEARRELEKANNLIASLSKEYEEKKHKIEHDGGLIE